MAAPLRSDQRTPTSKDGVLPLHYGAIFIFIYRLLLCAQRWTRLVFKVLVPNVGLEPTRLSTTEPKSVQSTNSSNSAYGTGYWIRTNDLLLRRQLLYPTELILHFYLPRNYLVKFQRIFRCLNLFKPFLKALPKSRLLF